MMAIKQCYSKNNNLREKFNFIKVNPLDSYRTSFQQLAIRTRTEDVRTLMYTYLSRARGP